MASKAAGKKKTGNCSGGCNRNAAKETVTGGGECHPSKENGMLGATGAGRLQHVSLTFLLFDFESTSINVRDSNDNRESVNGSSFA